MENLTNNINVFVRLFASINHLFCHVRWLERNFRNSSLSVLLIVAGIILFAIYFMDDSSNPFLESLGFPPGFSSFLKTFGPFLIVVSIIGLFIYRRFHYGPQGGNMETILFGDPPRPEDERVDPQSTEKLYHGTPVAPHFVKRSMV
jgi:purine-cytosine permease-like protein